MEQTWPLLSRHLLLDEAIVYPLCGYVGQSYAGPEDSLELLFGSLEREHQQISAALEMMRHKVSQVPLDKHCPKLIELAQAIEFFGYAWETHATKVDKVLLPRLRHVLKGPAGDGIPDAGRHAGNRY
jgi:iron-sulfur cluster repair protein YtfE (RIC family)